MIAPVTPDDWPSVSQIYREGMATGNATFETETPTWERWNTGHLTFCRLLARDAGRVLGFAAVSPVSAREVYRGVAEASVYVAPEARGRGVGSLLLQALIESSEQHGIWTLQASIFPENEASIALTRKHGFRVVGTRERIAQRDGRWRDTVLLERRSRLAAFDR